MEVKIIVLGRYSVGKTSILHKLKTDSFADSLGPTLAIDYVSQKLQLAGTEVKVQFWDTAGQEKYNNIAEQYYRKADGCIIVASCDAPAKQAVAEFQKFLSLSREHDSMLPSTLLLNKRDLIDEAYLQELKQAEQDILHLRKKYDVFDFRLVSAKTTPAVQFNAFFEKYVIRIIKSKSGLAKSELETTANASNVSRLCTSAIEADRSRSGDCCS